MKITEYLKKHTVILDGGMGTLLQKEGLKAGELPERWNITHSDIVTKIHSDYFSAGSNVVNTNTFGANVLKFSETELDSIVKSAVQNARCAAENSGGTHPKWVALDIGPTGRMLKPYGDLDFEDAVEVFAKTVRLGVKYGVDLIMIETMSDSYETKAALLASKENCELPVFVSNAYGEDGRLMTGATPSAMVAMLEGMGADVIGVNCSLGPKALLPVVEEYLTYASVPVLVKPNAGMPKALEGKTVYDVLPQEFAEDMSVFADLGVGVLGGCCGTTPQYIKATTEKLGDRSFSYPSPKCYTCVSSYTHSVIFGEKPILIGERINPTGKKLFKEALRAGDMDYILKEGIKQQEKGVSILDVNVGLPEIDEVKMLTDAVCELQAIINLPLQIDTADSVALEKALRRYNGKPMINSVNGKQESMESVFPLAKKYGGLVVALTLDERGIPETAEERFSIAVRIVETAQKYGISKKDIIFDPLALTISSDNKAAKETLKAISLITEKLGCKTSLGVSNVSFGLPSRDTVNASFFTLAMGNGLSAAIMNPYSADMMKAYYAYCALAGLDENCNDYIDFGSKLTESAQTVISNVASSSVEGGSELQNAIIKGLKDKAAALTSELLRDNEALSIVQNDIVPALDLVGIAFEKKTLYLPQLLMSAEAANSAFEKIKEVLPADASSNKCAFVIATVKGDIHDIGKNIVKLLLENYGFKVTDLGKDVEPERIVDEVIKQNAPLVGLSALMTTTVPAMEDTIKLIREKAPWCKTVVGGAVLTKEYAEQIGADKYAKDAMETVRYAEKINTDIK